MSTSRGQSEVRVQVVGLTAVAVFILPVFLAGAMAVQIRDDLVFGAAGLGLAVAAYRGSAAVASPWLGPLADRLGATLSLRLAAAIAAVTSLGIALAANSRIALTAWLALGGLATALGQPAANRLVSNTVPPERLGAAFGIKQSAPPTASTLAGFGVPLLAVNYGWRSAYYVAAALAVALLLGAGRRPPAAVRRSAQQRAKVKLANRPLLVLLAVAFGLGTATSSSVTAFYVDAAAEAGSSPGFAGTILAASSIGAICVRVVTGWLSDRINRRHLWLCAGLLAAGSIGVVGLASATPTLMAISAPLALAGTWGFNGVFIYTVVRAYPASPGAVTGAVAPGALVGGAAGPLIFGVIAETWSYPTAFVLSAVLAVLAAAVMVFAGGRFSAAQTGAVPDVAAPTVA